jgi:hypothetical protein
MKKFWRSFVLASICLIIALPVRAQQIMLSQLMGLHSLGGRPLAASLRALGWRDRGVQAGLPKKPRLFVILDGDQRPTQLYFYCSRSSPLCKLELVSDDVSNFNRFIRDSLDDYGFEPETTQRAPDEENLRISSSAYFVNRDLAIPIYALILYFEQRGQPMVSLTLYSGR